MCLHQANCLHNLHNISSTNALYNWLIIICRPLSKTVRFNVVAHEPQAESGAGKKQFRIF